MGEDCNQAKAIQSFNQVLVLSPNFYPALTQRGVANLRSMQYSHAIMAMFIQFVGTHKEYDRINAAEVELND